MFSDRLGNYLKRAQFPLKSDAELPLWDELIKLMEVNATATTAAAKALMAGLAPELLDSTVIVNGVTFEAGGGEVAAFVGAMHTRLLSDFDIYNRRGDTRVMDLAKRLRKVASLNKLVKVSSVQLLPLHSGHGMGTGLTTKDTLTFLPDPSLYGADAFGSQPDQRVIGGLAPLWKDLKKRRHVGRLTGAIGRKTHYVLAHLLNHQVNGSGADPANVVPFYADSNTAMAVQVEVHLKELVHLGIPVSYNITMGAAVGMTPGRQAAWAACETKEQQAVIDAEQHLPDSIVLSLAALDGTGVWHQIVAPQRIDNFVPETVPTI